MTVQDFILFYNQTFRYLHELGGRDAVLALWKDLADEYGWKLEQKVAAAGLRGLHEFFYGDAGTAAREHVGGESGLHGEDTFFDEVEQCPSIHALLKSGLPIYRYYCEHCYWIYAAALVKHGFAYQVLYQLQEPDDPCLSCCSAAWTAMGKQEPSSGSAARAGTG